MTIHEYGADKEKVIVLVHPSVVMWDFFLSTSYRCSRKTITLLFRDMMKRILTRILQG